MVVTDIQVCFALGAIGADLAAPAIRASASTGAFVDSAIYVRLRNRLLLYPALFLGPAATLFMLSWPGWESQYLAEAFAKTGGSPWNALPFALFLVMLAFGAWFGNWLGFKWVLAGARTRLRVVYGSSLLLTGLVVLLRWRAVVHLGSYADFVRDPESLPHIWQDSTFLVSFAVLSAYCALPIAVLAWLALREHRAQGVGSASLATVAASASRPIA